MNVRTSPLVQMAEEAKRPTRWWLAWIVGILLALVGVFVGGPIGTAILGDPGHDDTIYQYGEFFVFGITLVLLLLWVRLKERRRASTVGFRGPNPLGRLVVGFLIGAAMMTVGVLVALALGQYATGVSQHTNSGSAAIALLIPLVLLFVFQASTEEAVFRGYMLQTAGAQKSAMLAIIGTSVLFSLIHMEFHPVPLLNILLYAVLACFVALGQGSLWLIAGLHAGWNYFQGNIFGLPVSGNPEATSLLSFGPAQGSNELVTGGDFGVEASLIGTAVLVVALLVSIAYYQRAERARAAAVPAPAAT